MTTIFSFELLNTKQKLEILKYVPFNNLVVMKRANKSLNAEIKLVISRITFICPKLLKLIEYRVKDHDALLRIVDLCPFLYSFEAKYLLNCNLQLSPIINQRFDTIRKLLIHNQSFTTHLLKYINCLERSPALKEVIFNYEVDNSFEEFLPKKENLLTCLKKIKHKCVNLATFKLKINIINLDQTRNQVLYKETRELIFLVLKLFENVSISMKGSRQIINCVTGNISGLFTMSSTKTENTILLTKSLKIKHNKIDNVPSSHYLYENFTGEFKNMFPFIENLKISVFSLSQTSHLAELKCLTCLDLEVLSCTNNNSLNELYILAMLGSNSRRFSRLKLKIIRGAEELDIGKIVSTLCPLLRYLHVSGLSVNLHEIGKLSNLRDFGYSPVNYEPEEVLFILANFQSLKQLTFYRTARNRDIFSSANNTSLFKFLEKLSYEKDNSYPNVNIKLVNRDDQTTKF